jgi:DnaK suppressor protein
MSKYHSSNLALRNNCIKDDLHVQVCFRGGTKMGAVAINGLVEECKRKLLQAKAEILNRVKDTRRDLHFEDKGGDEADQTVRVLAESETLTLHERLRSQLLEIEMALSRIENGTYGVCEETEERIEPERLRAIPWTRLSIEGAEIRESIKKRYAR